MNRKIVSSLLICFMALSIVYCCANAYAALSSIVGDPIDDPKPHGDPIEDPIPNCMGDPIDNPKPNGDPIDDPKPRNS